LSNHHTKHNYYQIILDNKEALATKEFGVMSKLLTINIDLGDLDNNLVISDSNLQSSIEKKSRDTIFIKTLIIIDDDIIASSSSVWTNNC
tara:strand:- start:2843 stop:3112 length:270 start_codon:yes stop_codon:yes gene_type:complete